MTEHILIGLASIVILGILGQWLAWRLHLPSILLLLIFGFIAGPLTGILNPDEVFGELLFPLISVSVAIILFEGGLSLRFDEIKKSRSVVFNLTTFGIIITWVLTSSLAYLLVGIHLNLSILLGAILVVSGPTVIIPILRQIRPTGRIGSIIKWEGIVNDPLGALLAVIVFEVIIAGDGDSGTGIVIWSVFKALLAGGLIGLLGGGILVILLKKYLIPDFLQNGVSLMIVVVCYIASDSIQSESGLLAVTVMGIALANQKFVSIRHILEFKENLRVLIISSLFIILAAKLTVEQLIVSNIYVWLFIISMIIVVRPVMVFLTTLGSKLEWREKLFLSWMAPRGIVAAAVASVFALRLAEANFPDSDKLVVLTFQVIIGTVAVYGLTAPYVARFLKVARPNPQGVLIAGAHHWAQQIAKALQDEDYKVILVDSNWDNVTQARVGGLEVVYGNILSEELLNNLPLDNMGRFLALTPNDEVNSLSVLHFSDIFGKKEVYQLVPTSSGTVSRTAEVPKHLRGRYLFSEEADFDYLNTLFNSNVVIKKTPITDEFDFEDYILHNPEVLPMFIAAKSESLVVRSVDNPLAPSSGETLISVVKGKSNKKRLEKSEN
ncbi:MAG: sodium:proton antiporter [bacterium]